MYVTLDDGTHRGRGEAAGVYYMQDDLAHMTKALQEARAQIEAGPTRQALRDILPPGGARAAVDAALWELEARRAGTTAWRIAGLTSVHPVRTTLTVSADTVEAMTARAVKYASTKAIKVKLTGELDLDLARVRSIRAARPDVWLGVDANQGYSIGELPALVRGLCEQRVLLLEQPLPRGREADLQGFESLIPIAADESVLSLEELPRAVGRFDVVNIKLDKCGGLTEGLMMAEEARRLGLEVMVGTMIGTSLATAPAFILAQQCSIVDLDGPTFLVKDRSPAVVYRDGDLFAGDDVWGAAERRRRMTSEKTWFGHPRGLTVLFLTNMWEQFSYYGMRAILVYYMTKQLLLAQDTSSIIYGIYTGVAYFTPLIGGFIADRFLGKKRAIIIGGSVMALGHFMMTQEPLFYVALATIAIGNGLFLPSLPSQIRDLYPPGDPRAGRAYNVYYVGVNIGGFLAMLVCGALGETFGWHWGFGAAGVGMVTGLLFYLWGQRYLPAQDQLPRAELPAAPRENMARDTLLLLFGLGVAVAVFRSAYEQVGNTVALWADTGVDKMAGEFSIPMTWFIAINPLCVMLITPLLLAWWRKREAAGLDPGAHAAHGDRRAHRGRLLSIPGRTFLERGQRRRSLAMVRAVLGGADIWRVVHSSHRYRAVCPARAAATGRDDRGVLVSGHLRRQPGRRPGWNPLDAHEPSGLLRVAGRDLRDSRPLDCASWTRAPARSSPSSARKPIPVDNSLIRTLVSVSEYSWPKRARRPSMTP